MALTAGARLGPYEILALLGAGGMGEVYKARDTRLGRTVAIKVLAPGMAADPARRRRFEQEARVVSALSDPHICVLYDIGSSGSTDFLVMEYLEGASLATRLARGRMPLDQILQHAIEIAGALDRAHRQGVVHRDLKPSNVMLTSAGAKLLDFGLAKLRSDDRDPADRSTETLLTRAGQVMGTVPYMAPEQLAGREVDRRADLFSLGVMLYEMVAGQRPFRGDTVVAQISSILVDEPPALADACPGVPADLARVVHACLARRVEDRVQSATEVREQLLRIRAAIVLPRGSAAEMGGAAGAMPNSIAVLPFTNMSADREQEYFCDGIAEEIINALTRLEGLRVVARTSAFAFKGLNEDVRGIGRKLDVGAVLEGSVRKSGERLRITAQLVNVADGYHLWSQRFDRHLDDIFDIQDEISLAIVDRLKVTLLDAERLRLTRRHTVDRDAYDLYLRGRYIVNQRRGDIATAIALFRQAIERDPGFALPHLGLAEMGLFRAIWGIEPPPKVLAEAKAAAARGLELDEESGDAHVIAGFLEVLDGRDWRPAVRHFRRGLDLGFTRPQSYFLYAMFLGACGDTDRAIAMAEQSHLIDPLSAVSFMGLGTNLAIAGRLDEAALMEQRALELEPAMIPAATWLGWIEILRGRYEEATGPLQLAIDEGLTFAYGLLGLALGLGGHREDARATLARAHEVARSRYVTLAVDSLILTGLGETDSAMDALAAAWTESNPPTGLVLLDTPVFRFLPAHPRLAEFRARLAALRAGARDASGRW